jgi:excisionase family DNA binding protein
MSAYARTLSGSIAERSSGQAEETRALTRNEVMTAREVAELLKMPVSTIYQLARRGELPASRLGRTWRFLRPRLESCLPVERNPRSGCGCEDLWRTVARHLAVRPGDSQLVVTIDEPLEVDEGHRDHAPVFIPLDPMAFGSRIRVRGETAGVIAVHAEVEHIPAFVVRVVLEFDACDGHAHRSVIRGSRSPTKASRPTPEPR